MNEQTPDQDAKDNSQTQEPSSRFAGSAREQAQVHGRRALDLTAQGAQVSTQQAARAARAAGGYYKQTARTRSIIARTALAVFVCQALLITICAAAGAGVLLWLWSSAEGSSLADLWQLIVSDGFSAEIFKGLTIFFAGFTAAAFALLFLAPLIIMLLVRGLTGIRAGYGTSWLALAAGAFCGIIASIIFWLLPGLQLLAIPATLLFSVAVTTLVLVRLTTTKIPGPAEVALTQSSIGPE